MQGAILPSQKAMQVTSTKSLSRMHSSKGNEKSAQRMMLSGEYTLGLLSTLEEFRGKKKQMLLGNLHQGQDLKWPLKMSKMSGREGKMSENTLREHCRKGGRVLWEKRHVLWTSNAFWRHSGGKDKAIQYCY